MAKPAVGSNVDGWCARCKLMLAHTVEAVVGEKITRVHCNTCGAQHAHKKNQPGTAKKRAAGSGRTSRASKDTPPAVDYQALLRSRDTSKARPYKMSERFTPKEIINHPVFGLGLVVAVRETSKIDVGFAEGLKTLAHAGA